MANLTAGRRTAHRPGHIVAHPLAASAIVQQGGLACLDAAGYLVPGSLSASLTCVGIAAQGVGNVGGAAGDVRAEVRRDGAWRLDNHTGDAVGRPHIGRKAYIVDDHTVAATPANDGGGNPTRSVAGTIIDVDDDGVWIVI